MSRTTLRFGISGLITAIALISLSGCKSDPDQSHSSGTAVQSDLMPDLIPRPGEQKPSPEFLKQQESVQRYRSLIDQYPDKPENYVALAQIYVSESRITGKHHEYIPVALRLVDESLRVKPDNFVGMVEKASILMTLHQFEDARTLAMKVERTNGNNAALYGVLCDANVELGNYDEAVKACDRMLEIRPDLRSYSRASYLRELHGDIPGAIEAMEKAINASVPGTEERAWLLYNFGNLFLNLGKLDSAEYIYSSLLEERPDYSYGKNGLAAVLTARGNTSEAIMMLVNAVQNSSDHILLEHLSDIYVASGNAEGGREMEKKVVHAFEQHEKEGWNVDREYALFCCNHDIRLDEALRRAERDYHRRPDNIDALDTYAWALYKNGRASEAVPVVQRAMRLGKRNAITSYHAGMIYHSVGDNGSAGKYLQAALKTNPYLNEISRTSAEATLSSMHHLATAE